MATTASLHKNKATTLGRIKCFIAKGPLSKNPIQQNKICRGIPSLAEKLYSDSIPFTSLQYWNLPGGNGAWQMYSFDEITNKEFKDVKIGDKFGPTFSTHWFKVKFKVPTNFNGKELHLRFCTGAEATIWSETGTILGAFSPNFRNEFVITKNWNCKNNNSKLTFFIEMACNGMFGGGMNGENLDIGPPDPNYYYTLALLELSVFERSIFKLFTDIELLYGMATELAENDQRGYQAMYTANEMINLIVDCHLEKASNIADSFFGERNGQKAHSLVAMGHCHIDTAWLWCYDETIRKCARSWKSQIELMKEYPEFIFSCSQAQQFYWMKKYYPELFEEIKEFVRKGNFVPVGGTWVEMDGLLPSGESFIRQFLYGQKFFQQEFGMKCKEFFLPDTFGYSGQIPGVLRHVGIERFLTQKLSWSIVNKFPHHNFIWEGIDGSQVLVHFPPGDSYTMTASVKEILKSVNNSNDKGRCNVGAYLFGHGDGGGGPTFQMLETLKRIKDVDGLPKIKIGSTDQLFELLSLEKDKLCKWVGELYLELHNGTYTSQAKIKWYNRKLEQLINEVELILSIAYVTKYEKETLQKDLQLVEKCWKRILLNQFHDVIPGSCIKLVKDDAWRIYKSVINDLNSIRAKYHDNSIGNEQGILNPLPWDTTLVICTSNPNFKNAQETILNEEPFDDEDEGRKLPHKFKPIYLKLAASGYTRIGEAHQNPKFPTNVMTLENRIMLSNGKIELNVKITDEGIPVESLVLKTKNEEQLKFFKEGETKPGMFYIFDDVPLFWDAWDCMDYHLETRKELPCKIITPPQIIAEGPLFSAYKWSANFGEIDASSFSKYTILRADSPMVEYFLEIDWKENHKFLKVEFPLDILAREATYEIQFGHLKRPTHTNTSWDMAKFEVSGQKWMTMSQGDKGVCFITDSKYGWHVRDNVVQLSLLRSPKSPDYSCDMHKHYVHYAVLPFEGTFQEADVVRKAYEFNFLMANDVQILNFPVGGQVLNNFVTTSNKSVIVETVKVAECLDRKLCIRLYESFGGSASTRVNFGFPVKGVEECNGLEETLQEIKVVGSGIEIKFTPFQIKSFLIRF